MKDSFAKEDYRPLIFIVLGTVLFTILGIRLFSLQIIQGAEFREKSDNNRFRLVEIAPPRGVMRDRHGKLILTNRATYTCYGVPNELWKDERGMAMLNKIFAMPDGFLRNEIISPIRKTFLPRRIRRDLSFSELSAYEELRDQIPGAFLEIEPKRYYESGIAAHTLGYVSEISKAELDRFPGREAGDLVGKRGLERIYDKELRGESGHRYAVVNVYGQEIPQEQDLGQVPPVPGKELWLTLDLGLQAFAESLMVGKTGAAVAMDVRTGGVLCMASAPTYDPEIFAGALNSNDWKMLLEDPDKPMLNRCIQTMYPPGSTVKMAMLIEGLESGIITPQFTVSCPGHYTVGNRTFKCWKKGGHGRVGCVDAIEQSCDVFFYTLGMRLGVDGVHNAFDRFHFGKATGVDVTSEADGLVPSTEYYNKRYGPSGWTRGFIPSISIGQGEVLFTPLQECAYAAAMADGKYWRKPYLVQAIFDPQTDSLSVIKRDDPEPISASPQFIAMAREGMRRVVNGDRGTARAQRDELVSMAGKTGTAQNSHGDDHAWFIGFAPVENPVVATCVLVEFGMHGSSAAAPIAAQIMKKFVLEERGRTPESKDVAQVKN
jgi:penicillin-binding protein 2